MKHKSTITRMLHRNLIVYRSYNSIVDGCTLSEVFNGLSVYIIHVNRVLSHVNEIIQCGFIELVFPLIVIVFDFKGD